ncbi:hypothetical protein ACVQ8M_08270 [Edwardsiella tarda]|uniref:Uncharacterized protein n=1 Tax=Edwardsiella tarda ATCC 23685 TaxID=500638 RepID=D4F5W8_EDWTA|nr:hypothetical protein [Edwardsiella tarda]EFE22839.1 hypothetical protein EDWATA_02148 [Edwardsiella tarda ATCC 23685]GAC63872.1 hypothetical protein ET1_07_01020 [Edwardsiella tarda ATCC 15947 = NBRC 105688]STD44988.1 Uncharacterised protein [Edwardsiella tarda]
MGWASDTFADLTRQQYQDWRERFYPRLKTLMEQASGEALLDRQLGRANWNTQNSLRSALSAQTNQMARYGTPLGQEAQDHRLGLRTALAHAGAKNGIREAARSRRFAILTGGASGIREQVSVGGDR